MVLAGKKPIKLHNAIDDFVKSRKHMPSATNCELQLRRFKVIGNHFLDKVTNDELDKVITDMREEEYAESTIQVTVTYFNAMIKHLDEKGYTVRKKMKPIKHDSGKVVWLSKEDLQKLYAELDPTKGKDQTIKAAKQDNYDLVRLLYETGCRITEITTMRWSQINFANSSVFVHRLKGSVDNTIGMTKTMREIFTRRKTFENGDYAKALSTSNQNTQWFGGAVKRAALDVSRGSITPHTLRHSRCVHLLQGGLGIVELQHWIGHATIQSTMVYAHVAGDDVAAKVQRLTALDEPVSAAVVPTPE
jgi:integrase